MQDILLMIGGLVALVVGGEGLVRGSVSIAKSLKLSTLLISVVIIGFGTSMPEMVVSLQASFVGSPDISLGNVVGSNIANTSFILGLAAMLCPIACKTMQTKRDIVVGIVAALLLIAISYTGELGRLAGAVMFLSLVSYIAYCVWSERKQGVAHHSEELDENHYTLPVAIPMTVVGIAVLIGGAKLLVMGAIAVAQKFGVSEAVIGLTIIAVGTSLPELAAAMVASYRKHSDVVIGNIFGSNFFNILGILGVTGMVNPIKFSGQIAERDVWIMLAIVTLPLPIVFFKNKLSRLSGAVLFACYVGYIGYLAHG